MAGPREVPDLLQAARPGPPPRVSVQRGVLRRDDRAVPRDSSAMRVAHPPRAAEHLHVQHTAAHDVHALGSHPRPRVELERRQLRVETQPIHRPRQHGLHPLERSVQGVGPRQRVPRRLRRVRRLRPSSSRGRRRGEKTPRRTRRRRRRRARAGSRRRSVGDPRGRDGGGGRARAR